MSPNGDPHNHLRPDNDRLIDVLQACFSQLIDKQEEQMARLNRTLEALKPQAPKTDRKTAFWNSYMKLADEHDMEFQRKYITDLDTSLIFVSILEFLEGVSKSSSCPQAGLFSAVSSAFIIQIQPQLATNPAPSTVVVQSLLYTSLFATLLAALLAVLGKQWIMYYEAAGSRGTIEERGLERQRKLDGLRRWKFDMVLQMFPLLLQLALLLFASALSVYLWSIHRHRHPISGLPFPNTAGTVAQQSVFTGSPSTVVDVAVDVASTPARLVIILTS
ncbi:hypothetical protein DFH09DRAFT_1308522 [Mycena vulgaris]|nr:hypothetical protein DFH09DRAFT_1308522 [Mycena vulgaris]